MRAVVATLLALLLAHDPVKAAAADSAWPAGAVPPDSAVRIVHSARPATSAAGPLAVAPDTVAATGPAVAPRAARSPAPTGAPAADPAPGADLGPSSDPPWNPPRPLPRRQAWERVLTFPGRVATLPLSALGLAANRTLAIAEDHGVLERIAAARRIGSGPRPWTLRLLPPNLGDRTGFGGTLEGDLSLFRHRNTTKIAFSHSTTIHDYHDTHVRLFGDHSLEFDEQWRPWDRFYGIGAASSIDSLADYALHTRSARGVTRLRWNKRPDGPPRTELAAWLGTRGQVVRRGREPGTSSIEARFPALVEPLFNQHQEQLVYGAHFASDWRLGSPHWREGWRVLVETERYDKPVRWLAIETTRPGAQFTRTTVELEGARSYGSDPRTFRLLGRVVQTGVTANRERMQLDEYARLGGRDGLTGEPPGRFHDLSLVLARLSYVFPLERFLEMDVHVESGAVYPDLTRSPKFDQLQQSAGIVLRGRTDVHPQGSVGIERSRDAIRFVFTIGNPDR